jgi:hypothetical protein
MQRSRALKTVLEINSHNLGKSDAVSVSVSLSWTLPLLGHSDR